MRVRHAPVVLASLTLLLAASLAPGPPAAAAAEPAGLLAPERGWPEKPKTGKLKIAVQGVDHPNAYCLMGVPESYTREKQWPLWIVLHGGPNGRPDDLASVFRAGLMQQGAVSVFPKALRAQLLEWNYPHSGAYLLQIIRQVAAEYRIDPRRVYLAGHSMGGGGVWVNGVIMRELWAALGPMSGWYKPTGAPAIDPLKDMPIYCVHGRLDAAVTVERSRLAFKDLKALGCQPATWTEFRGPKDFGPELQVYREIQDAGHDIFQPWAARGAKEVGAMVAWMSRQARAKPADVAAAEKGLADFGARVFKWQPGENLGTYNGARALPAPEEAKAAAELQTLSAALGKQLADKDYPAALKTCDRMVELAPRDAGASYNRACVLARLGRKPEALDALAKAVELGFTDADHLAKDEDLADLRAEKRFQELVEAARAGGKKK